MIARLRSSRGGNLFVELLMLVVGINIALGFEGWFEDLQDAETERDYLAGLHADLQVDMATLDSVIASNEAKLSQISGLVPKVPNLSELTQEEQANALFAPSSYLFFDAADFTYRSMQESGDFRLLQDEETKKEILRLMRKYRHIGVLQDNFLQALDAEYIPLMMSGFDILQMQVTDPNLLDSQVFRNFFAYTYQDTEGRLESYRDAREVAASLSQDIESQLNAPRRASLLP